MPNIILIPGGIDNKHDPIQLGRVPDFRDPSVRVLTDAVNVDLDDNNIAYRRDGTTLTLAGTSTHSFWANRAKTEAYFVEGGVLKQLKPDETSAIVRALSNDNPVDFEQVNSTTVFSNGQDIGYIENGSYTALETPEDLRFKVAMSPGQYLAFYNGVLWAALGNLLVCSDPYKIHQRDTRHSMIPLPGYIRMLAAVEDGLWVATDKKVSFLQGGNISELTYRDVTDKAPADGCFTSYWEDTDDGAAKVVVWASESGFCTGRAGGNYANLSETKVAMPTGTSGACAYRSHNGMEQYIAIIKDPVGGNTYTPEVTHVTTLNV